MKSEIGYCVWVIWYQLWGKTRIDNHLRSKSWWEHRLKTLIEDSPVIELPIKKVGIYDNEGNEIPAPSRYEDDYNLQ